MAVRAALLIGIEQYSDPQFRQLRTPTSDAQYLARLLEDPEVGRFDEVKTLPGDQTGVSQREIMNAIDTFFRGRNSDDFLLFYFGGHGIQGSNGELIFCARDTFLGKREVTGVPANWVSDRIATSRSRRVLALLDCCFSGAFPAGFRPRAHLEVRPLAAADGHGRVVITASSATEFAFEADRLVEGEPAGSSAFTPTVIAGIETGVADRDGDGRVSVTDLYKYVHGEVSAWGHQTPTMRGEIEGDLYISYRGSPTFDELTGGLGLPRVAAVPQPRAAPLPEVVRTRVVLAPRLRDDAVSATVRRWLCAVGQHVSPETALLEILYHDNGQIRTIEILAGYEGMLRGLTVVEGERIVGKSALAIVAVGISPNGTTIPTQPRVQARPGIVRLMQVTLPEFDDGTPATVIHWWRGLGDRVENGQPLLHVRVGTTEIDVTSKVAGTIRSMALLVGESAKGGEVFAIVSVD